MTSQQDYVKKARAALDELRVRANLARMELRDVGHDLLEEHDAIVDRLHELQGAAAERWDALREGFESAWQAFRKRYDEVMERHGGQG